MDLFQKGFEQLTGGERRKTIGIVERVRRTGVVGALQGVYEPAEGTPAIEVDELRKRLLALNGSGVPFQVVEGEGAKEGDLVAKWKILDAVWWDAFRHVNTTTVTDVRLVIDAEDHEVRGLDKTHTVSWNGQIPRLDHGKPSTDTANGDFWWRANDPLNPGQLRNYDLETNELRDILGSVIADAGWTLRQVWRKKTLAEGKD